MEASRPELTPEQREALDRVFVSLAENADAVEQLILLARNLSRSGVLAGLQAALEDLDENFSAATRPELMGMVANLMMVLGLVSELAYEPFFDLAMNAPRAFDEGYAKFKERREKLSIREAVELMRSPEVAGALEAMVAVLRAQRTPS
jgi:uncharacterized protein YjgD (DUF1641 family)